MPRGAYRILSALAALVLVSACGPIIPAVESVPAAPASPTSPSPSTGPIGPVIQPLPASSARLAGLAAGPSIASLRISQDDAAPALRSFIESCPQLQRRGDQSGLASGADWAAACQSATQWPSSDARSFFESHFEAVRVGKGEAFATGYFEQEIAGVRTRQPGFEVPVYGMPDDLTRGWTEDIPEKERQGRPPLARQELSGKYVPYYARAEIESGALDGRAPIIGWAADPVEFFFLQIQGSGRLRAPDGSVIRIGYAGQNGRAYTGIGGIMRERGLLGDGPGQYSGSMQGIMQYIREHPAEGRELMQMNESWVFFRELTGDGPIGALGVPVRGESSVAADPNFVPLGAPVFLQLDRPEANGLWIAQDTGGAIKGANRFDTFWGAGERAREMAGGMSGRGQALLFLPKGTLRRLGVD